MQLNGDAGVLLGTARGFSVRRCGRRGHRRQPRLVLASAHRAARRLPRFSVRETSRASFG